MGTGIKPCSYDFSFKGRPLADAKVRLVPEPFLADLLGVAEGVTNSNGTAALKIASRTRTGAPFGYYRLEVTSDKVKIPAKYNTETTLGVELSPTIDGTEMGKVFNLK